MSITPFAVAVAVDIAASPTDRMIIDLNTCPVDSSVLPDAPGVGMKPTAVMANDVAERAKNICEGSSGMLSARRIKYDAE